MRLFTCFFEFGTPGSTEENGVQNHLPQALAQPDSLDKICENLDRLMKTTA